MSIFSDCVGVGLAAIEDCARETVTYYAPNAEPIEIEDAIADRVNRNDQTVAQTSVKSTTRVQWWRIKASRLGGVPVIGATITRAGGKRYQLQNPNNGPVWQWAEGQNTHYLICSIEIKAIES
jgi:hypothetical protein